MDVKHWKKVMSKKSQNGHVSYHMVMSVITLQWHHAIKSTPFFRVSFSDRLYKTF